MEPGEQNEILRSFDKTHTSTQDSVSHLVTRKVFRNFLLNIHAKTHGPSFRRGLEKDGTDQTQEIVHFRNTCLRHRHAIDG